MRWNWSFVSIFCSRGLAPARGLVGWLLDWLAADGRIPSIPSITGLARAGFGRLLGLLRSYIMRAGLGFVWGSFGHCKGLCCWEGLRLKLSRFGLAWSILDIYPVQSLNEPNKPIHPHPMRPQQAQQSPETSPEKL